MVREAPQLPMGRPGWCGPMQIHRWVQCYMWVVAMRRCQNIYIVQVGGGSGGGFRRFLVVIQDEGFWCVLL